MCLCLLLVHALANLLQFLREVFGHVFEFVRTRIVVFEDRFHVLDSRFDVGAEFVVDVLFVLFEEGLSALNCALGLVSGFDGATAFLVLFGVLFGLALHAVDFVVGETSAAFNGDGLGVSGAFVLGGDVDDTVFVDVEADFNLRRSGRCRRDAREREFAEEFVVFSHLAFTLEDADLHRRLVVGRGGENLRLLGRDGRVLLDEALEETTLDLDTERQRRHVEEDDVVDLAAEDATLNGRAECDGLVGVDGLLGLGSENLFDLVEDLRHAGRATDEDDVVDVVLAVSGVFEGLLGRFDGAVDEVLRERLELRAGQVVFEVDRTGVRRRDEGEVDGRLLARGEFDLGFFGRVLQALEGLSVLAEVDAVVVLELRGEPVDDCFVPVVTAEFVVPVRRDNFVDAAAEVEDGNVESTATKVVDENRLVRLVVETVGHRRCGRFVDDTLDFETCDFAGVFRRLTLFVVEVRRDGDDRLFDLVAEVVFGVALDFLENHRRNLLRRVLLALDIDSVPVVAHVALDGADGVLRVLDSLVLRRLAHQTLTIVGERDDGRSRSVAFCVHNNLRVAALHYRERAVRGTEVDTQNLVARHLARKYRLLPVKGY
ncbi:NAD-specific glutamate dehydrogenase [Haloferax mediterranei ATCC 33500]|uniref:NAD-specific glutamate dehydrogenase n=1 Tax=Haloferax mediterranei (strain ATCC 33500 / DSM 1411 / JCM 8866 / NBRC 14739 / NCIMB 2177 / R-4) TaxID=523841 RepID=M0J8X4_HALMT|nr:NAD-specific glutamate dehydrogenase [Haloferax mediterranei ATCC 33500]